MDERSQRQRRVEAAGATLELLLAVQDLVSALDVWDPYRAAIVLLALKDGPKTPAMLALRCGLSAVLVRQRLRRYAAVPRGRRLVERCGGGRYRLTAKGHRCVNELAGVGVHILLPQLRSLSVTPVTRTGPPK